MKRKILSILLCIVVLASSFSSVIAAIPVSAKTDVSAAAPSLIVNKINPDGTVSLMHEYTGIPVYDTDDTTILYYTYPELEALVTDINYYSTIDAMPAAVGTKAYGVTISDLVNNLNTVYDANIKWESGQRFVLYPTDASTTPYQGSNFYTYNFVQGQPRYYYPNMVEAYTLYRANGENSSYLTNALDNPVPVEPVLCLSSYQERYASDAMLKATEEGTYSYGTPGTADYREINTPVTMSAAQAFRFCMGLTTSEASLGLAGSYSSTNKFCRWVYRIDFGPVNGPALTADTTDNIVGQQIGITFNDDSTWRSNITGITVDGVAVDPSHYTVNTGCIMFDNTVFTANGSYDVTVLSDDFMNTSVTQTIGIPPALTADSTNNSVGQSIDITFTDNSSWRAAVTEVTIDGTAITDYTLAVGKLTIPATDFTTAVTYTIVVKAAGYDDTSVSQAITGISPTFSINSPRTAATPFSISFADDAAWRAAITDIKIGSTSILGNCVVTEGLITFAAGSLANGPQKITIYATNYTNVIIKLPPVITADTTNNVSGQSIELKYSDTNFAWYTTINDVLVNDVSIAGHYTKTSSKLTIANTVFTAPGEYAITIKSSSYSNGIVIQTIAAIPVTGVSLDKNTDSITAGFTDQLTATVTPSDASNKSVSWESDNTLVATVDDNGLVTAVAEGTANITVTTADGSYTATCVVTVQTVTVAVTGVSLDKNTDSITAGSTDQLTATVEPSDASNKSVSWESDNTFVATVDDNGLVTAVAEGTANITVTTADGSYTATCVVTVQTVTVAVTGVSLDKNTDSITAGFTDQLTATVEPSDASNKSVSWESDNTLVATVDDNGLVTAVAEGTANITVTTADGSYTATCVVTVNPVSSLVWDGTIDVSWYNTTDTVFYINTPAQLAGLAAIVNGLYNPGATVIGNPDYIHVNSGSYSLTGSETATTYWGDDSFKGKTIYITADLDMGGVYDNEAGTWSGPNYMPIGGQYCVTTDDPNTLLNASFNGTLDGQGHTVKNIYCNRYYSSNFAYSQSIGLIGRLGVHDSDGGNTALKADNPAVRNVVITGYIYGRRSVGGIVGKIGQTNAGAIIENCANFATIVGTDSKGTGGICGAGWNGGYIMNCYNAGSVSNPYSDSGTGGIVGSDEIPVINCYNIGIIDDSFYNYAIGKDNGGATTINCYWLTGSALRGSGLPATECTSEYMKSAEFLTLLNGDGRAFVADTFGINNGYPVLRCQIEDTSAVTSITKESDPAKLSYVEGEIFDADGLVLWANYDDNTREKVTGYIISNTGNLQTTDTTIIISGIYGGVSYSYEYTITVASAAPTQNGEGFYELSTAKNMQWFVSQVNGGIDTTLKGVLMNDIDLSGVTWTPIGNSSNKFAGIFDGDGKTITLNINSTDGYVGLFGYIQGGTIENVTIAGNVSGGANTGAVVGYALGNSIIRNCVNNATVTSNDNYIGGIAGGIYGTTVITGCVNNGTINGSCVAGGIVGTAGYPTEIRQCANHGAVNATGTSTNVNFGLGGIVGWARSSVDQCYNTGTVTGSVLSIGGIAGTTFYTTGRSPEDGNLTNDYNVGEVISTSTSTNARTGGLVGYSNGNLCNIHNCYNAGTITVNNTGEYTAGIIGYAGSSSNITNSYYLDTTAAKGIGNATDNAVSKTSAELAALAPDLGGYFKADLLNINNGYPVLKYQVAVSSITKEADPSLLSYVEGQTFDTSGLVIWANYIDGTHEQITDYVIDNTGDLQTTDTSINVSGTFSGLPYSFDIPVTVIAKQLESIAITNEPNNILYVVGDTFDPAGMVVTATYTNGTTATLASGDFTLTPNAALTVDDTQIVVSYTYNDITVTANQPVTVLAAIPNLNSENFYELYTADDMQWFANQVNSGLNTAANGKLMADIDLSAVTWTTVIGNESNIYTGIFDGDGKTITLNIDTTDSYIGLFGYISNATIQNLTVSGNISGNEYVAAIAGYAAGSSVISNCVNNAAIITTGKYCGGIVGRTADAVSISRCSNTGSVTSESYYAGGITGYHSGTGDISLSSNTGNITGDHSAGGIAGRNNGTGTISLCFNTGSITATSLSNNASYSYSIGGIAGYVSGSATIDQCYNSGSINGIVTLGGIVGYLKNAEAVITNVYNTGEITNTSTEMAITGGIIGYSEIAGSTVQNTYNAGAIIVSNTGDYTAGIIGCVLENTNISNNYYLDTTAVRGLGYATDNTVGKTSAELGALASDLGQYFKAGTLYPILTWQNEGSNVPVTGVSLDKNTDSITAGSTDQLTATVEPSDASNKSVSWESDNTLVATVDDNGLVTAVAEGTANITVTTADGSYTATCVVTVNPVNSLVWDGTIDVSWYNTTDTVFYINTPAQLAGLAAIVNGIYNTGATVIGNPDYIHANWELSSLSGFSDPIYTSRGDDDFEGKIVYITADLDMGGIYDSATGTWSGPNYMPIGGQYPMDNTDTNTEQVTMLNAPFNGTFDGQGHTIKNIYCNRYAVTMYDMSQSIGLIGRLGVHDDDDVSLRADNPAVRNVIVTGYIYGRRSVGGIVGKIGKTNKGGIIENCANFATIVGTDSKGTGGICGAGWNGGYIINCYNAGNVSNPYGNVGGIVGSDEISIINCYNIGTIGGSAIGNNNGGAYTINCYWLTGSASRGSGLTATECTSEYMKSAEFLVLINGDGRAFVADTLGINNGYPILRCQIEDTTTVTSITKESDPALLSYVEGQTFDSTGLVLWANYSDGTREKVTDYTISNTNALLPTDTTITVSGICGGMSYSYEYPITVAENAVVSIAITKQPTNILYATGEIFDPTGIAVKATYTNGTTVTLITADYTLSANAYTSLTAADSIITVSYTYKGVTMTADQAITVLDTAAPSKNGEDTYELYTANDMRWFANQVNTGLNNAINGKLMDDIDLSGVTWTPIGSYSIKYTGTFNGNDGTISLNIEGRENYSGLFGYIDNATIQNLTVAGSISGGQYTAGIVGCASGASVISNCINNATITGYSYYAGGIAGYISDSSHINQCSNTGAVTSSNKYAGGITGYNIGTGDITQCSNMGDISSSKCYVGGIAGYNTDGDISQCSNTGNIEGSYDAGGITGYAKGPSSITLCFNTGSITATSTSKSSSYSLGGISGNVSGSATIDRCYNAGTVTGGVSSIGGIVGYLTSSAGDITNVYNTGTITNTSTSSNSKTGGIIGYDRKDGCIVQNTYNAGAIIVNNAGNFTSAIAGYAKDSVNFSNNYYLDTTATKGLGYATDNTVSKTSAELKALAPDLGQYFKAGSIYPILVWQPNEVAIDAPDSAAYDSDFTVSVNISDIANFNVADYIITYDPTVLRLDSITGGSIGSTTIPVYYNESTPGTIKIVNDMNMAATGVSGYGTLAILHFHVIGNVGASSDINLSSGTLASNTAEEITAVWGSDMVTVGAVPVTVTLSDLEYTYDGTAKYATVTVNPLVTYEVTYYDSANNIVTDPTEAGSYTVVVTVTQENYEGSATGTLVIDPIAVTVTLSDLSYIYDGAEKPATVTTNPEVGYSVTYNGSETAPVNAGSYEVVVTVTEANYSGTATGTLVIGKADQIITFVEIEDVLGYLASDFSLTATASSGLTVSFTAEGPCEILDDGVTVHITGVGECTITAHQEGNENYNAATVVIRTFNVIAIDGDANGDGVINALDLTKTIRIVLGLDEGTDTADANGDGVVNALDIAWIEQYILNNEG